MELKCWLLFIRILNITGAAMMVAFEIWFTVDITISHKPFFYTIIRMFVPVFVILLAFIIITSEFKFTKMVQHFKFLQFIPGLALFYTFMASIMAFQFSTEDISAPPLVTSLLFVFLAIIMGIMGCFRPPGAQGLLATED